MSKEQTAVDLFYSKLLKADFETLEQLYIESKELEKKQIILAYTDEFVLSGYDPHNWGELLAEEYYNLKYK